MRRVLIMVGIPGCGKSTVAEQYRKQFDGVVVSADHYFINPCTQEYEFDPKQLPQAHSACMCRFIKAIGPYSDKDTVVVDNTNLHVWEWRNYYDLAKAFGFKVEFHVWEATELWQVRLCAARNTHGVPLEAVARMALAYQNEGYREECAVVYHKIEG